MVDRDSIGMKPGRVVIRPSSSEWPLEFERVCRELKAALPSWILEIEHVGSTAVTGLDAKPIVDVLLGVPDLSEALELVPMLESLGFEHRERDDIPDRHYFPRSGGGVRMHHLSVAEPSSRHYRNSIVFRNALRANPELASRYSDLKHRLAEEVGEVRHAYLNGKTEFIRSVLKAHGGELGGGYPIHDLGSAARR